MATIKLTLDRRQDHQTSDGKSPLVLRIGHRSASRDIPFNLHLKEEQFNESTGEISGILNSVRHSKRVQKILRLADLWMADESPMIAIWPIEKVKSEIEKIFFDKQIALTLLTYGGQYLRWLDLDKRHSTASSYEDALKAFVKYNMKRARLDIKKLKIKTLYDKANVHPDEDVGYAVLPEYEKFDMAIKAIDPVYAKAFRAHLASIFPSPNTTAIYLRSLDAVLNDAGRSFSELKNHKPLEYIKKGSTPVPPNSLDSREIHMMRMARVAFESQEFHAKNYFLFMFNNMGMNFFDMAILRPRHWDGERINYFRKKTINEGDYFSVRQTPEAKRIIEYYVKGKDPDGYIFPVLYKGIPPDRIHKVKNYKIGWFNKWITRLARRNGIKKKVSSTTPRDSWTNIGLTLGIDIRKISSGLGHSTIEITDKHYAEIVRQTMLDDVNAKITSLRPSSGPKDNPERNDFEHPVEGVILVADEKQLTPRDERILHFIENHGGCRSSEISKELNIHISSVKRALAKMLNQRLIKTIGFASTTTYYTNMEEFCKHLRSNSSTVPTLQPALN